MAQSAGDSDPPPLIALAISLADGAVDLAAARTTAAGFVDGGRSTAQECLWLGQQGRRMAGAGQWRRGVLLAELALTAADRGVRTSQEEPGWVQAWLLAGSDVIVTMHVGLDDGGDLRLYRRATELAETMIPEAARLGMPANEGLLHLSLGTFVLDAYTARFSTTNYQTQFAEWVARALQTNDPALISLHSTAIGHDGRPDPDKPAAAWPEPLDALIVAERHLRAALPLVVPERRGPLLKALAQAIEWQKLLGGPDRPAELRETAESALAELPPEAVEPRLFLANLLSRLGDHSHTDELVRQVEDDWDGHVATAGPMGAWGSVDQVVVLLQDDPRRALRLLDLHRELPELFEQPHLRSKHFEAELTLFARAYAPNPDAARTGDFDAAVADAAKLIDAATTPTAARTAAAAAVAVMIAAGQHNREADALELTPKLGMIDNSAWQRRVDAINYLISGLYQGEGVNRVEAGDFAGACHYYRLAVDTFRAIDIPSRMVQTLLNLDDLVRRGADTVEETTAWLAATSLDMETAAPAAAPQAVLDLAGHLLARATSEGTSAEVVQLLMQVAKGRRYAAMLLAGTGDFRLDEQAEYLLTLESGLESELPDDADVLRPAPFDAGLGDDDMLVAWVNDFEAGASETPMDRLANGQREFERHLTTLLVPAGSSDLVTLDWLQGRLRPRTALVLIFEAMWIDGSTATWQLVISRGLVHAAVGREDMPFGTTQTSWHGRSLIMSARGLLVADLRRDLQHDPGPLDVSGDAADLLTSQRATYLRAVDEVRDQLVGEGVDHLLFVGHGPSHYLPMHLLTDDSSRVLADDWTVTYLLNLAQLSTPTAPARADVAVFGLAYSDQPTLPRLDDSVDEAQAVARVCAVDPKINDAATEEAFVEALQSCRYVHLRAHGRMYVDAPSFHTVFLHPTDAHDGRLRAYEVLGLDLSGLELVTLGACETAVGRVDRNDNPRGLPSALLLAGAHAVIGTLWPVLAAASTHFFTTLYRGLITNNLDLTTAFAGAQQSTRSQFPQHRDWGAFYLIGGQ